MWLMKIYIVQKQDQQHVERSSLDNNALLYPKTILDEVMKVQLMHVEWSLIYIWRPENYRFIRKSLEQHENLG